ncbi:MAG: prolyl oligopeptidase family serine peptidase, partial [Pseudomonadota bacterium]
GRSGVSLIDKWRRLADREGLILIGPDSHGRGWRLGDDPDWVVQATLYNAAKKHPIDTRRIYLFGHSGGGMYGSYLMLKRPKLFAAGAFHAGCLPNPSYYGDSVKLPRTPPALFILGDGDGLYGSDLVQNTAEAFARHGHQTEIQIVEGHDHWYYDIATFINAQAWQFLKPHQF